MHCRPSTRAWSAFAFTFSREHDAPIEMLVFLTSTLATSRSPPRSAGNPYGDRKRITVPPNQTPAAVVSISGSTCPDKMPVRPNTERLSATTPTVAAMNAAPACVTTVHSLRISARFRDVRVVTRRWRRWCKSMVFSPLRTKEQIVNRAAHRVCVPLVLAVALVATGCSRKSACLTKGTAVRIAGGDDHTASISPEQLEQGTTGPFVVHGADHDHAFLLKQEEVQKLRRGEAVTTRTTSNNAHLHEVTVRCKE